MRTINVQDAKTHLSRLLRDVEAGEEIAIARNGHVIARLVRAAPRGPQLGGWEGRVTWDEDAFAPMTDRALAQWEGPIFPTPETSSSTSASSPSASSPSASSPSASSEPLSSPSARGDRASAER